MQPFLFHVHVCVYACSLCVYVCVMDKIKNVFLSRDQNIWGHCLRDDLPPVQCL